jgi:putative RNA 2'-phosphotransferase
MMIGEKESIRISKFLSFVLRHQPETIGIQLDKNGWTDVAELIQKSKKSGVKLDFETLRYIVNTNSRKRFAFNDAFDKIRASQGHSVDVELGYQPQKPPEILYHGTGIKSVDSILQTGLEKRNRHHVHLSSDVQTAAKVGERHGKPVVFEVSAGQMYANGFKFYLSENGVWLTEHVPPAYLKTA